MLARAAFSVVSPSGPRARLSILIFHRVLAAPDPLFPEEMTAARFDRICSWLNRWFRVLPLPRAIENLRQGTLPERALAITFDDGYQDNQTVALPVLQRHGLSATFFIATSFLDGGCMWNDIIIESIRRTRKSHIDLDGIAGLALGQHALDSLADKRTAAERLVATIKYLPATQRQAAVDGVAHQADATTPQDLMMTSAQVRALRDAKMTIGGHTVSHPILARLDVAQAREEIVQGKQALEKMLGERIALFAYPNGKPVEDFSDEHATLVKDAGFDAAVTTARGAAGSQTDRYLLPRFTPWDHDPMRFGLRLFANLWHR